MSEIGPSAGVVTQILNRWNEGGAESWNQVLVLVYEQLHAKARQLVSANLQVPDIQATMLVSELYLKYQNKPDVHWQNSQHFYAHAALTLRGIIVDTLRKQKPGSHTSLTQADAKALLETPTGQEIEFMALENALQKLEQLNPAWCRVVEFRFFLGLSIEEVASALAVSEATVNNHWVLARRWLHRQLYSDSK
jgi:RNA polymerase sigma factor (TIGR02999 family)